jgi:hypothetical protein
MRKCVAAGRFNLYLAHILGLLRCCLSLGLEAQFCMCTLGLDSHGVWSNIPPNAGSISLLRENLSDEYEEEQSGYRLQISPVANPTQSIFESKTE